MPHRETPAAVSGQPGLTAALEAVYWGVPATQCASSGECCRLTETEYRDHYATMFPLYRAEYASVADFVRTRFSSGAREELLAFTQERPRRCPFLSGDQRCTIYPVRPLICRTYAVMCPATIAAAAAAARGTVPAYWLHRFVRRESGMQCPRVRVVEPDKVAAHAQRLIRGEYERELLGLSRQVELLEPERLEAFAVATGGAEVPVRWSWGGFNALCRSTADKLRTSFRRYWERCELVDAG